MLDCSKFKPMSTPNDQNRKVISDWHRDEISWIPCADDSHKNCI